MPAVTLNLALQKIILFTTVFICGAAVMVFELAGARFLAPYFGLSFTVWTSLIGVMLLSLSCGYWWGGVVADRSQTGFSTLARVVFGATAATLITAGFEGELLPAIQSHTSSIQVGALVGSFLLFAPATLFLGMVTPISFKLSTQSLDNAGASLGKISALSSIGSIVGTFSGGLIFIANFSVSTIVYGIVLILFALAALLWISGNKFGEALLASLISIGLGTVGILGSQGSTSNIAEIDTLYSRVIIRDELQQKSGDVVRKLITDPFVVQSGMIIGRKLPSQPEQARFQALEHSFERAESELALAYTKFFRLVDHFCRNANTVLMLGGGAYTVPRDFLQAHPTARIDVVEIDPALKDIAHKYFGLKEDPRLHIIHDDARVFLNRSDKIYSAVFVDVFGSGVSAPFTMTTKEAVTRIFAALDDSGVALVNLYASISGESGKFFQSLYATYASVFPQVLVFAVDSPEDTKRIQNIMLVALKSHERPILESADKLISSYLAHLLKVESTEISGVILTDRYAPVELFAESVISVLQP